MVGEWIAGCVVSTPLTPSTAKIYLLNDVLQRTNLAWRANTMVQINADNTTHHHLFRRSAMRVSAKTMDYKQWVGVCAGGGMGVIMFLIFILIINIILI